MLTKLGICYAYIRQHHSGGLLPVSADGATPSSCNAAGTVAGGL